MDKMFAFSLLASLLVPSHPVPDGVVFRGVQVVVYSSRIEVRYHVGLHDNMVARELRARAGPDEPPPTDATEALSRYRDLMFLVVPQQIRVTLDDQPLPLEGDRADLVLQQHTQIEFVYHIPFTPQDTPVKFVLQDDNYPGVPGFHLAAIRSRGGVDVLPSGGRELASRLLLPTVSSDPASTYPEAQRRIEAYLGLSLPTFSAPQDAPPEKPVTAPATDDQAEQPPNPEPRTLNPKPPNPEPRTLNPEHPPLNPEHRTPNTPAEARRSLVWSAVLGTVALVIAALWLAVTWTSSQK
jgi:hypothetical protein